MVYYYLFSVSLSLYSIIFRFPISLKVILYMAKITQNTATEFTCIESQRLKCRNFISYLHTVEKSYDDKSQEKTLKGILS